jgi:hypothetical protein
MNHELNSLGSLVIEAIMSQRQIPWTGEYKDFILLVGPYIKTTHQQNQW